MSRLPLLRRTTAEMSILLSAATLCRIRRDTFLGVMPSVPTGSILSDNSVGVPINSARSRISSERRMAIWPPRSSGCVRLSDISSHTFSALRSSVSSRYSMSRPMQKNFAVLSLVLPSEKKITFLPHRLSTQSQRLCASLRSEPSKAVLNGKGGATE